LSRQADHLLSAVNKAVDGGSLLTAPTTVDDRRCYTLTVHVRRICICK